MRKGIHPEYREVLFVDITSGEKFVTRSTVATKETMEHEGQEYPVVKVEVSSASHPFYTGRKTFGSRAGRVERFNQKFANRRRGKKGDN